MNEEEIKDLIAKTTVLMQQYQNAVSQMSSLSNENIQQLTDTIKNTDQQIKDIIQNSDHSLARGAQIAIETALDKYLVNFQEKLNYSSDKILQESQQLVELKSFLAQRTRILTWKAILVFVIAVFAIVGLSLKFVWTSRGEYKELQDAINRAEISLEVKEALKKVEITSCGGTPCIKIDISSRKWGNNGEYILIEK